MNDVKPANPSKWPWLGLFFVLSATAVILGHVYYLSEIQASQERFYEELHAIATLKVSQIQDWRKERITDVGALASSPFFSEAVKEYARDPQPGDVESKVRRRLMMVRNDYRYDDALLVGLDGNGLISAKHETGTPGLSAKREADAAVSSKSAVFGDLYVCPVCNRPHIDVAAPVLDEEGRPAAVLVFRLDPATELFPLIQSRPTPGKTGETLLVRRDGDDALFVNDLRHRPDAAMKLRAPLTDTNMPAVRAVLGKHGHFEGVDYRGVRVLADVHPVVGTPWFLVAKVDVDEATAEVKGEALLLALIVAAFVLTAAVGTRLIYESRQRGLYELMYRSAREKSEAREELRAALYSIGDGVISTDVRGAVRHINPVAENLTGWSESDAAGRPVRDVFRIINEETREEVTNPVERVLSEGKTVGLANHTVLIAKDGRETPIADSGAPIEDDKGDTIGVVLVFRDQTEERAAQKALEFERAQLMSIFESVDAMVEVLDPATYEILYMNGHTKNLFGKDGVGKICYEFFHGRDAPCDFCTNTIVMDLKGEPYSSEYHSETLDRDYMTVNRMMKWPDGRDVKLAISFDITERKRAERELLNARREWELIFHAIGHVTVIIDLEGVVLAANQAAVQAIGKPREEVIGKKCHELFHGLDHHPKGCPLARVGAARDTVTEEMEVEALGGHYLVSCTPMCDESGAVERVIHIATDITARKRAEEELRENRAWYKSIVEEGFDGIFVQKGLEIVYANSVLYRMLGYSEGELVGMDHATIYPPELRAKVRELAQARMRGETLPHRFEVKLLRKDGSVFDGEILADVVEVKGEPGVRVWVRDVSEQRGLEDVRRRLATAVEQAGEAIVIADAGGIVEYVNPAHERVTGYAAEEAIGELPPLFREHELAVEVRRDLARTMKRGAVWSGRVAGRRKDGSSCELEVTVSPVLDDNGRLVNIVGVERDVTAEVQLHRQLLQAQKMEAVGTLAGGIAHDFNNILQVVLGFSELILAEKQEDDPEYADLGKILRAAKNGADLVQRLLMFSRRAEPKLVPMSLNKRIVEVEQLIRRTIPRMIQIRLELGKDLPRIYADPSQVEQVLMNLAVNARDAMPEGGTLTVSTAAMTLDEDYCRFHLEAVPGEYVALEVADTGHGMNKDTMKRIFEPFFTTKEVGRGTGLGLATVHGIVKRHHGHITVYSEVGRGTSFRVYFPAIESGEEAVAAASDVMPAFGSETILLVDDEAMVRELGARILTKHGYIALQAGNGREALDLFRKQRERIHLVILDLIMPDMGGKECLKELLEIDPKVKAVIASGYSADASTDECLAMGAKGFVPKPFRVTEMPAMVRKVLDEK